MLTIDIFCKISKKRRFKRWVSLNREPLETVHIPNYLTHIVRTENHDIAKKRMFRWTGYNFCRFYFTVIH